MSSPSESTSLESRVKRHKVKQLTLAVDVTDAANLTTALSLPVPRLK